MGGYTFTKPHVDGQGFHRCESCWNGFHNKCRNRQKLTDCKCPCHDEVRQARHPVDPDAQLKIDTGDDVIEIRDEPYPAEDYE